jgi:hypothetical protein
MKSVQAIWRFVSSSWLIAAPLIILFFLFVGAPILLAIIPAIAARVAGADAADTLLMDVVTWTWVAVLVLAPLGLTVYGAVRLARWLVRERAP